jgi:Xaa-Pro aminopeptidase
MNPVISPTNEELARARAQLKALGADWALLSSADSVSYVSHFEVPVEFGASAAQRYAAPMAYLGVTDSATGLLVSDGYAGGARAQSALGELLVHEVFVLDRPVSPRDNFLNSVRETLHKAGLHHGKAKLAVEERTLPMAVQRLLANEFPNVELLEAEVALAAARLIKTARELDLLRAAAEVNRAGHTELLKQCQQAGQNEVAMWSAVIHAMEQKVGHPLMVFGELVTGKRCGAVNYPGGPKDRVTAPGDLALMDMSPRVHGYWSDCTNTMVIGGVMPNAQQKRYGVAAREAFHAAADTLRPGRKAHEAFDAAQATFAKHGLQIGHYAGHQIGLSVNEHPRLVPFEQTVIQAGMVFSIEPGAYQGPDGDTGARMEKSVIVRADGPELLCDFVWGF